MAYSVAQMYPSAFTADVNFVDGKYKNSSAPGVYDGTPLDNLLFNQNLALFDALMLEAGLTYNNSADIPSTSQLHKAIQIVREVSPRNNQWNGYLDPEHQSRLPSPNGYPADSGGGGTSYTADQEISDGIFAGASGATVSSDSDGWILSAGSIYRLYTYTIEQLADIDINTAPIFIRDEAGNGYHINNSTTGVSVSKPDTTTLRVEIDSGIFAELGITKLWRWFDTEKIGYVIEKDPDSALSSALGTLGFDFSSNGYHIFESGLIVQWGTGTFANNVVTFPIAFPTLCIAPFVTAANYDSIAPDFQKVSAMSGFNQTTTQFTIASSTAAAKTCNWLAIGY